jgi:hypothetical protein
MAAIDLRPLSLGELLDRTFSLYRRHFLLFIGISAIPYSIFFVINLGGAILPVILRNTGSAKLGTAGIAAAAVGGVFALIAIFIAMIAFFFSVGGTVFAVSDLYLGRQTTIRESLNRVRGHAGTIFGVSILTGLLIGVGFIALVIPGVYLMCRVCVAIASALLEDLGPSDSIRRSFELTRDFAGRAFLIYLLYFALVGVAAIFQAPFGVMMGISAKQPQMLIFWTILAQVGNFVGSILIAPVSTISFALFYYDLRVRKEAFDLQMMMRAIGGAPAPPAITGGVPSMFGRDAT